ncbi:pirin family protein [candidate division KSB1 bacterium]
MPEKFRNIIRVIDPQPVLEGAGVRLKRSIATHELNYLDPFLLFDDFSSDNPADYTAGFPMHPHRGIETVTYILAGVVTHKDSLGNSGDIKGGDVQWMTSGSGIMHEEMPKPENGKMAGFQLWVNLPAKLKMSQPRYQDIASGDIPVIKTDNGVKVRVISGQFDGVSGPVTEITINPAYLDVDVPPDRTFLYPVEENHSVFAYVFEGEGRFGITEEEKGKLIKAKKLLIFGKGDRVKIRTEDNSVRFLLVSGKPINEPIARYGPFVMNTSEEIQQALADLQNGTFIK